MEMKLALIAMNRSPGACQPKQFAGQQGTLKPAVFLPTALVEALVSDHLLDHVSFGQQLAPIATRVNPLLEELWKWLCQTAILPTSKLAILQLLLADSLLWLLSLNRGGSQGRTSGRSGSSLLGGCSIQVNINSHGSRLSFAMSWYKVCVAGSSLHSVQMSGLRPCSQ